MKILITICARGGSKGIPGKNIKLLNGRPLINYTIEVAKKFKSYIQNADIALSTDSNEILKVSSNYGLSSDYIRPTKLSGDNIGKIEVIKDILLWQECQKSTKYTHILDLDVTSPMRNIDDLINGYKVLNNDPNALNLFSVNTANRNPYFNMVEEQKNGYYKLVCNSEQDILARQLAPDVYDLNASFYFYRRSFFDKKYNSVFTDNSLIYEMPHTCFDLDNPIDFEIMDYLVSNNKLDFKL